MNFANDRSVFKLDQMENWTHFSIYVFNKLLKVENVLNYLPGNPSKKKEKKNWQENTLQKYKIGITGVDQ